MSRVLLHLRDRLPEIRAALPAVAIDEGALARRLEELVGPDEADALDGLHLSDLAWAEALARGDAGALSAFERDVLSRIDGATRRIDPSGALADSVRQELRVRLLVGDDGPPKILRYAGRGPLLHWVLVAATRLALDHRRRAGPEVALDEEHEAFSQVLGGDLEHDAMRLESRRLLKGWIEEALAALDAQHRAVLSLYFVEDVSSEAIGKMFGAHRGTVARWIAEARDSVRSHVRRRALLTKGMGPEAVASLLGAVDGHLSLSLSLLRS